MRSLLGQMTGMVSVDTPTRMLGKGLSQLKLWMGACPRETQVRSPERCLLGRNTEVTEHRILRRNWRVKGLFFFVGFFFFFDPSILKINEELQNRAIFPRCIFLSLAEASPRTLGCWQAVQTNLIAWKAVLGSWHRGWLA